MSDALRLKAFPFLFWWANVGKRSCADVTILSTLIITDVQYLVITEYLVNISKRRAFWSLNEDILKINDSDYQYAVSIKEDKAYPCLHSPNTTKERRSIRHSENDNEKVNLPSLLSPEPTVSCFVDLDFFKDFKNEFTAIVYNDAQTPKSDLLTESISSPQHIDEFDLNDKTSLSEYDEEEQNVLYFTDLFPFNIIHPDDLKSEKDNDDNEIDPYTVYSFMNTPYGTSTTSWSEYLWLLYQVEGYTKEIVHDFEQRLETIFGRQVNRVHILDFKGLTPDMRQDLAERIRMVYTGDDGQEFFNTCRIRDEMGLDVAGTLCFQLGGARRSMTWRQFILALGLHTTEEMAEDGFGAYWLGSDRLIPVKGDLSDYLVEVSSGRDFLRGAPSYTYIKDPVRRLCHRLISYSISKRGQTPEKYLFMHAEGRKSGARLSGGHFIRRLAHHFGLVSDDGLRGLYVVSRELTWDGPAVDEGGQAISAPVQTPQQPPPPPPIAGRTMP
ncbi:hypothetical protein Tco_0201684 [Tanacetum coccineum]